VVGEKRGWVFGDKLGVRGKRSQTIADTGDW